MGKIGGKNKIAKKTAASIKILMVILISYKVKSYKVNMKQIFNYQFPIFIEFPIPKFSNN
jgi:hypothetical protein